MRKADYPAECGWDSCNQLKCWFPRKEILPQDNNLETMLEFPACCLVDFWLEYNSFSEFLDWCNSHTFIFPTAHKYVIQCSVDTIKMLSISSYTIYKNNVWSSQFIYIFKNICYFSSLNYCHPNVGKLVESYCEIHWLTILLSFTFSFSLL